MKQPIFSLVIATIALAGLSGCATTTKTKTTAQAYDKTSDPLPPVAAGPTEPNTSARSAWGAGNTPSTF